jgi:succinoglycan biosynthesis transport protein ExoP
MEQLWSTLRSAKRPRSEPPQCAASDIVRIGKGWPLRTAESFHGVEIQVKAVPARRRGLHNLFRVLGRRRRLMLLTAGTVFLLAVVLCILTPRKYTATSSIRVQATSAIPGGTVSVPGKPGKTPVTPGADRRAESDILWSDWLAVQIIKELNLQRSADLNSGAGSKSPSAHDSSTVPGGSLDNSPELRNTLVRAFHERLSVQEVPKTQLMTVSYTSRDPYVAADVVNHLVKDLVTGPANFQEAASNPVAQRLQDQLNEYRKHSEDLQSRVVELQQNGGDAAATKQPSAAPESEKLQKSAAALSQATMNRILKQAAYDVARSGNPAAIAQLSSTESGNTPPTGGMRTPSTIQNLLSQETALKKQIEQDSARFGSAYPPLAREKATLRSVEESLQEEIAGIGSRARTEYEVAVQGEESARTVYDADRSDASKSSTQGTGDTLIAQEAEQSRQVYQDLLQHLNQQGIAQGLPAATITVVDPATPPASPTEPDISQYLVFGAVGGLLLGAFAVLVAEVFEAKRRSTPGFRRP